jgi:hypothetical protein
MGDADPAGCIAFYLETWRRKNGHLHQWECDTRRKAQGHRDELFKRWVASMKGRRLAASKNLRAATVKAAPEDEDLPSNIRLIRARSAPGRLAELLKQAGAVEVKAAIPEDLAGVLRLSARCVGILEKLGEDVSDIRANIEEQRAALRHIRNAAE